MKMIIAIIPARGGSKRIPNKNIRLFCGKPIIAYSIEAARETGIFDHIVCSTDSDEIAKVAVEYGAEVPFRRTAELSNDYVGIDAVLLQGILDAEKAYGLVESACCIYATAPMLRPEFLRDGLKTLKENIASSAIAVTSFAYPILRAMKNDERGRLRWQWAEYSEIRSQDLPDFIHEAAQFYWVDVADFKKKPDALSNAVPVLLPRWSVQDIDTQEDWQTAEIIYSATRSR